MDEQSPINDPNCKHSFVMDPTDSIGEAVSYMCSNRNCGIGYFAVPPKQKL